jgi:hypothetical protein
MRREADHLPPSSSEVKKAWSYTSTLQYVFMAWCLVKHRDNFIFTFLERRREDNKDSEQNGSKRSLNLICS